MRSARGVHSAGRAGGERGGGASIGGAAPPDDLLAQVRAGDIVTLGVQRPGGMHARQQRIRLEAIEGDVLVLALHTDDGAPVLLWPGDEVVLTVAGRNGGWLVSGTLLGRRAAPRPAFLFRPGGTGPVQRRGTHRVPVTIEPDVVWWWVRTGTPTAPPLAASRIDQGWQRVRATLADLSRGGAGLVVDGKLPVGAWLYLTFAAPLDEERFTTWGQVVAAYPVPAAGVAGPHVQRLGVRFDGLTPPDRERLGFCLHRYQQYAKAAQTGVAAPPSPVDALDAAYAALCLCPGAPAPVVKAVYRALAHVHHPDVGGDARVMARINAAYAAIQAHLGLPD